VIQALQKRTKEDVTFNIDISLTQFNIWFYRLGQYNEAQCSGILRLNPSFKARHYDGMFSMIEKVPKSVEACRPGLLKTPEFYIKMSGKEWGEDRDISILGAPFDLSKSRLDYLVPSGKRGWSSEDIEWRPVA
jgi:hypothetical protein